MQDPYSRELEVAADAVRRAADRYVRSDGGPSEEKENAVGSYDLVTYSDRQAQEDIIRTISAEFPGDLFIAEEGEENSLTDARTWVIDPIDGTLNYERGIPMFGTQLVLMIGKEPVMSVIYLPVPEEMFTATVADGVRLNGIPVKPCGGHDLKKCIVSTGDFSRKKQEWTAVHIVRKKTDCTHCARNRLRRCSSLREGSPLARAARRRPCKGCGKSRQRDTAFLRTSRKVKIAKGVFQR